MSGSRQYGTHTNVNGVQTNQQVRDVPTTVKILLAATKELQESLRLWSIGQSTETDVSDVYVRLGTDFNAMVHAFASHGIDLSDIHSVPLDLRTILEQCLGEEPSPEALEIYMPDVRQVLYKLLVRLRAKQGDYWNSSTQGQPYDSYDVR